MSTMILRPVRPVSPLGPPISNGPAGLTHSLKRRRAQRQRHQRVDDFARDFLRDPGGVEAARDLGGDDHVFDTDHFLPFVGDGDLAFRIGAQPGQGAGFAQFGLPLHQAMRQPERIGHQVRGFVAGIAEHQALVAGADVSAGQRDAFMNLDRLVIEAHLHFAGIRVDAGFGIAVTDVAQHLAGDLFGAVSNLV